MDQLDGAAARPSLATLFAKQLEALEQTFRVQLQYLNRGGRIDLPTLANAELPISVAASPVQADASPEAREGAVRIPLTEVQKQLWFLSHVEGEASAAYNEAVTIRLEGEIDVDLLERALQRLVGRHEALRTSIDEEGDGQMVHPTAWLPFRVVDLSSVPEASRQARLAACVREESERPFNLARAPLLRVLLIRTASREYALVLTVHDIMVDGQSMAILLKEALEIYRCERDGEMWTAESPLQLSDYVRWAAERLEGESARASKAYWIRTLRDGPEEIDLPWDAPASTRSSNTGGRETVLIDRELASALREFAARERTTVFSTLFGAFTLLLHRLSEQAEIIVGVRAAVRGFPGGSEIVANTTTMLPIVSRIDPQCGVSSHMKRIRDTVFAGIAHADYPFPAIVRTLNPRRDPHRAPLTSICFNADPTVSTLQAEGVSGRIADFPMQRGRLDLEVNVTYLGDEVRVDAEYNSNLIGPETVAAWLRAYRHLLASLVEDPGREALGLAMLSPQEEEEVLRLGAGPTSDAPIGSSLWELFLCQARAHPEAVAARHGRRSIRYDEVERQARLLARHLRERGVGPECVVALELSRSIETLVSMLAVAGCGAAFLPLDPSWPARRRRLALEDTGAAVVLSNSDTGPTFAPADHVHHLSVPLAEREASSEVLAESADDEPPPGGSETLAYLIYTSGSTGRPKAAALERGGFLNHLRAKIELLRLDRHSRVAQTAAATFDISIWQFLAPLLVGGAVEIVDESAARNPTALIRLVDERGISVLETVPALLREILTDLESDPPGRRRLAGLRSLIVTGETLPPDLCERWHRLHPHVPLVNAYGPTECSDDVTHFVMKGGALLDLRSVPIGRPIQNSHCLVLDSELSPLPQGVPGELCVGGVPVGRGYLNDPERTRAAFVPDPFRLSDGSGRLYRTGDLARWDRATGQLQFLGRRDQQVKISGFRIELGEIEARLREHPGVRDAVVLRAESRPGHGQLVAHVVPGGRDAPSVRSLHKHLAETLPAYMIPLAFGFLDALPLGPNGKVDRRSLPDLNPQKEAGAGGYEPPAGGVEESLAEIWMRVLGVERVGATENFFDLGGDSILVLQVVRLARGAELPLSPGQLFEHQTVRRLAAALASGREIAAEWESVQERPESQASGRPEVREAVDLANLSVRDMEKLGAQIARADSATGREGPVD